VDLPSLKKKFLLSLLLGVGVVFGLAVYGNGPALLSTLGSFSWRLLPLILALTLVNYGLRFVKWHYYLGQIQARPGFLDSFAIFAAGLSMAMTPGKVGEVLKPILLKLRNGTPISRSAPIVLAERLTDGIAMIILALAGLVLSRQAWQVLALSATLAAVVVGLLGSSHGTRALLRVAERLPVLGPRLAMVESFLHSARALFTPRNVALAVGLGLLSWGSEGAAFYLVLLGLGIHASWTLLVHAVFVLAVATLVGSLSMLPGGLGAADASVTGLLILIVNLPRAQAAAATLLIRFCTLWFGVAVGLFALFIFRRRLAEEGAHMDAGTLQREALMPADKAALP
jgi:uncharacterized protein (TIRG00374 family)